MTTLARKPTIAAALLALCLGITGKAQASSSTKDVGIPSAEEQSLYLVAIKRYAKQYVSGLPNFICTQTVQEFEAGKRLVHWRTGQSLTFELTFFNSSEERTLKLVNNKPVSTRGDAWQGRLLTEGEFSLMLSSVFAPESETSFAWAGWETGQDQTTAVFHYSVDRQHSTLRLTLNDSSQAVLPYEGLLYANPETGEIRRITRNTDHIPKEVDTKSVSTIVDYGAVTIGTATYLLPVQASVVLATNDGHIRNEMQFRDYRKFQTDSTVIYKEEDKPPVSSQTRVKDDGGDR